MCEDVVGTCELNSIKKRHCQRVIEYQFLTNFCKNKTKEDIRICER